MVGYHIVIIKRKMISNQLIFEKMSDNNKSLIDCIHGLYIMISIKIILSELNKIIIFKRKEVI